MGQKVNPHGLRVGVIKDWDSKWYAEGDFADNLVEDYNIRTYLKKKLYSAGVSKIEIERASDRVKIIIYTAKPGVVIGKGGAEIEKVKVELQKFTDKKVVVDIKEVKRPDSGQSPANVQKPPARKPRLVFLRFPETVLLRFRPSGFPFRLPGQPQCIFLSSRSSFPPFSTNTKTPQQISLLRSAAEVSFSYRSPSFRFGTAFRSQPWRVPFWYS